MRKQLPIAGQLALQRRSYFGLVNMEQDHLGMPFKVQIGRAQDLVLIGAVDEAFSLK